MHQRARPIEVKHSPALLLVVAVVVIDVEYVAGAQIEAFHVGLEADGLGQELFHCEEPVGGANGLPARRGGEGRNLFLDVAKARDASCILHPLGGRAEEVVGVNPLDHTHRRARVTRGVAVAERPIDDVGVGEVEHRVARLTTHGEDAPVSPVEQSPEHRHEVVEEGISVLRLLDGHVAREARFKTACAIIHHLVTVLRDLVEGPLVHPLGTDVAAQTVALVGAQVVEHPRRVVSPLARAKGTRPDARVDRGGDGPIHVVLGRGVPLRQEDLDTLHVIRARRDSRELVRADLDTHQR